MVKEEWDPDEEIYLICRPKVWKADHSQTKVNKLLATVLGSSMYKDHPCLYYIRQLKNLGQALCTGMYLLKVRYMKYDAPGIVEWYLPVEGQVHEVWSTRYGRLDTLADL